MNRYFFRKLYALLVDRVEKEGKKSPEWFLGFIEGLGNRKLTGYQIGALVDLLLITPSEPDVVSNGQNSVQTESDMDFLKNLS